MSNSVWQCSKCGQQRHQNNPPGLGSCSKGGNHVWSRLARYFRYND